MDGSGTGELAVPVAEKVTGPFPRVEKPKVPMVLSKPGAVKSAGPPNTVTGTPPITRFVAVRGLGGGQVVAYRLHAGRMHRTRKAEREEAKSQRVLP